MTDMDATASQEPTQTPPMDSAFVAPSIDRAAIERGDSYTYHSAIPAAIADDMSTECVLGVDEAGRGPVLGPMVYGILYLPLAQHRQLLAETHHFDDSKVLTPAVRTALLQTLSTPSSDLFHACGWATRVMSARDIGAGMLRAGAPDNLNAQAMAATVALIEAVLARGVNVREIYIDTIGSPAVYQRKLERLFPAIAITVAKKADSLYPCVSAASVCAKVTRDMALDVAYELVCGGGGEQSDAATAAAAAAPDWGSGYPSDARCTAWLQAQLHPLFGWGSACRFSWATAKDMLDDRQRAYAVDWPAPDDEAAPRVTDYFRADGGEEGAGDALASWFGRPVAAGAF